MAQIDIHLVSWNRPKMTELVIKTIHRNTKRDNFRLVVLDNGSEQSTVDMLQNMHENGLIDELICIKTNLGLEAARNLMFKNATQREYFVCVDNDCLPPPIIENIDWGERLVHLMEKHEDFAAISMRTQVMIGTDNIFEEADKFGDELVEFPHPGGSFRIMRTKTVGRVGGWSREAEGRGQEEHYICGKLHDDGYKTAFATNIHCLHLFGNREETKERWGYKDGMLPKETGHSDITHPALANGDNFDEVKLYSGEKLAQEYFHVIRNN